MNLEGGYRSPNSIVPPTLPTTRIIFNEGDSEELRQKALLKVYLSSGAYTGRVDTSKLEEDIIEIDGRPEGIDVPDLVHQAQEYIAKTPRLQEKYGHLAMKVEVLPDYPE